MKLTRQNKDKIKKEIGRRMKMFRTAQGITLLELEVMTGITDSKLSSYERGEIDFQMTKLIAIADALQIPLSNLYPIDIRPK